LRCLSLYSPSAQPAVLTAQRRDRSTCRNVETTEGGRDRAISETDRNRVLQDPGYQSVPLPQSLVSGLHVKIGNLNRNSWFCHMQRIWLLSYLNRSCRLTASLNRREKRRRYNRSRLPLSAERARPCQSLPASL
jgi:hypothetical protein